MRSGRPCLNERQKLSRRQRSGFCRGMRQRSSHGAGTDSLDIVDGRPKKPNDSIPLQVPTSNGFDHGFKVVRNGFRPSTVYKSFPFGEIPQQKSKVWDSGLASCRISCSSKRCRQGFVVLGGAYSFLFFSFLFWEQDETKPTAAQ